MTECIFCKIATGQLPSRKVYENQNHLAFLGIDPITKGHTIVIPKKHSDNFSELSADEAGELARTVRQIAPQLVAALGADGYNLGCNTGAIAGQSVNHVHWHIIPRYPGDGLLHWESNPQAVGSMDEAFSQLENKIK